MPGGPQAFQLRRGCGLRRKPVVRAAVVQLHCSLGPADGVQDALTVLVQVDLDSSEPVEAR